ncbi:hypothetical protein [Streptomyces fulvoviolaceus]|uniref:hypothetical protein n=1 Tax=Streptomyces fulvoviolaceus TaxID=285535 RepID=UPI0021BE15AA|nr:hypothetical protein [Streptomyces fulvoviolaceus]MCT9081214.1 hypothetical protein [Streptomyces fulvoviolaceus]
MAPSGRPSNTPTRASRSTTLSAFQLTRKKLADTSLSLGGAALLALHLGRLKDRGRIRPEQLSVGLESVPTHEGTGEIHTLVIGQTLSGRSAYR